jgi:hypothetical protein
MLQLFIHSFVHSLTPSYFRYDVMQYAVGCLPDSAARRASLLQWRRGVLDAWVGLKVNQFYDSEVATSWQNCLLAGWPLQRKGIYVHSFKCLALIVLLQWKSSQNQDGDWRPSSLDDDYYVSRIKGIYTMNKMMPVWRRSVKRFRSYRIYCVLDSYRFMDGKMRGGKLQMQPGCKRI